MSLVACLTVGCCKKKANVLKELSRLLCVAMRPASNNLLLHAI